METITKSVRTREGARTEEKNLIGGRVCEGFPFSYPVPAQACLEVIMHDSAEGC